MMNRSVIKRIIAQCPQCEAELKEIADKLRALAAEINITPISKDKWRDLLIKIARKLHRE